MLQSPDIHEATQVPSYESAAARSLQLTPPDINLVNEARFTSPDQPARFLYGFTESSVQGAGFFKMSRPENNAQLIRESVGLTIAKRIGIPTVRILHPFQITPEGNGILHVERLDAETGTILTSPELIAAADPRYGARAALAFLRAGGRIIPIDIDSSPLKRDDWRNESPETFWRVWGEQNDVVFSSENAELVDRLIGTEKLRKIVDQTRNEIEPEIAAGTNPDTEYFVHNDAAPNNTFFSDVKDEVLFLDFEHAAASHNLTLTQLTDLGNYYGRLWPNPEMQQQFLISYIEQSTADSIDYNYKLLKATVVFGAMYLAKYAMKSDSDEHPMAVSLLENLEGNLSILDNQYHTYVKGAIVPRLKRVNLNQGED